MISDTNLSSFVYLSTQAVEFDDLALNTLAGSAAVRNLQEDITGFLTYRHGQFIQFVEGPAVPIAELLMRLQSDDRHVINCVVGLDGLVRRFGDWSMRLLEPGWAITTTTRDALHELLSIGHQLDPDTLRAQVSGVLETLQHEALAA